MKKNKKEKGKNATAHGGLIQPSPKIASTFWLASLRSAPETKDQEEQEMLPVLRGAPKPMFFSWEQATNEVQDKEVVQSHIPEEVPHLKLEAKAEKIVRNHKGPWLKPNEVIFVTVLILLGVVGLGGLTYINLSDDSKLSSSLQLTKQDLDGTGWQLEEPNFKPKESSVEYLKQGSQQSIIEQKLKSQKQNKIIVHFFPHSHTDLGWISTVDDYFRGVQVMPGMVNSVYKIIDTAIQELEKYDFRTFVFAEIKFFEMWWTMQNEEKKDIVRQLVKSGQLELINGGWSAPDEACPPYDDLLNNWMMGHKFLVSQFGYENIKGIKIGWELDAFGLSSGYARLASDIGMEALFIQRADHDEKKWKQEHKERIQIWRPFEENFGAQKEIISLSLPKDYCWFGEFWVDKNYPVGGAGNTPTVTNRLQKDYNVDRKMRALREQIMGLAKTERTNHIFQLQGCDFSNTESAINYQQYDAIMEYWNHHYGDEIEIIYSTPSKYIEELKAQNKKTRFALRKDDFFPYSDDHDSYFSGYYSSRPHLKKFNRDVSNLYHTSSRLSAMVALKPVKDKDGEQLLHLMSDSNILALDNLGVLQHHDAITGTSSSRNVLDYMKRLSHSQELLLRFNFNQAQHFILRDYGINIQDCDFEEKYFAVTNSSEHILVKQNYSKSEEFYFFFTNPHGDYSTRWTQQVKVPFTKFELFEVKKGGLEEQVQAFDVINPFRFDIMGGKDKNLFSEMIIDVKFETDELYKVFKIKKLEPNSEFVENYNQNQKKIQVGSRSLELIKISDDNPAQAEFIYVDTDQDINIPVNFNLRYYKAFQGWHNLSEQNRINEEYERKRRQWKENAQPPEPPNDKFKDGVYIFMPQRDDQMSKPYSKIQSIKGFKGKHVEEFLITYDNSDVEDEPAKAVVRLRLDSNKPHFILHEVQLNQIPVYKKQEGKDVIVEWNFPGVDMGGKQYWAANSMQMMHKTNNVRETYEFQTNQTYASNYYAISSALAARDIHSDLQFTLMNDRSQGGAASLRNNNSIELMHHRRLLQQDNKGVMELLDEKESGLEVGIRIFANYQLQIHRRNKTQTLQRNQQLLNDRPPVLLYSNKFVNVGKVQPVEVGKFEDLIENDGEGTPLKVLTLPKHENSIYIRVANLNDRFDSPDMKPKYFDLKKYVLDFYARSMQHLGMPNNLDPDDVLIDESILSGWATYPSDKPRYEWNHEPELTLVRERLRRSGEPLVIKEESSMLQPPKDPSKNSYIALEPQRIRMFTITYHVREQQRRREEMQNMREEEQRVRKEQECDPKDQKCQKMKREDKQECDPRDPQCRPKQQREGRQGCDPQDPNCRSQQPSNGQQGCDPRDPKCRPQQPPCDPRDPQCRPPQPQCDPRDPKCRPRQPPCDPRDPKCSPPQPQCDPRDPKCREQQQGQLQGCDPRDPNCKQRPQEGLPHPNCDPNDPNCQHHSQVGPPAGCDPRDPRCRRDFDPREHPLFPCDERKDPRCKMPKQKDLIDVQNQQGSEDSLRHIEEELDEEIERLMQIEDFDHLDKIEKEYPDKVVVKDPHFEHETAPEANNKGEEMNRHIDDHGIENIEEDQAENKFEVERSEELQKDYDSEAERLKKLQENPENSKFARQVSQMEEPNTVESTGDEIMRHAGGHQ